MVQLTFLGEGVLEDLVSQISPTPSLVEKTNIFFQTKRSQDTELIEHEFISCFRVLPLPPSPPLPSPKSLIIRPLAFLDSSELFYWGGGGDKEGMHGRQ